MPWYLKVRKTKEGQGSLWLCILFASVNVCACLRSLGYIPECELVLANKQGQGKGFMLKGVTSPVSELQARAALSSGRAGVRMAWALPRAGSFLSSSRSSLWTSSHMSSVSQQFHLKVKPRSTGSRNSLDVCTSMFTAASFTTVKHRKIQISAIKWMDNQNVSSNSLHIWILFSFRSNSIPVGTTVRMNHMKTCRVK